MGLIPDSVWSGVWGSLAAGLATGLGAVPILVRAEWSARAQRLMLAGAGGVMLGAVFFSLLLPAGELARAQAGSHLGGALLVVAGLIAGGMLIWGMHGLIPHEHFVKGKEGGRFPLARHWLLVLAIALHNVPEGMSVGVAYGGDGRTGLAVMLGIGLQNIPEGLAVAAALVADGTRSTKAFWLALASGLLEPVGGLIGAIFASLSMSFLPFVLAAAAGSMLFVILSEIVPETCYGGHEHEATFASLVGFVSMLLLDAAFA